MKPQFRHVVLNDRALDGCVKAFPAEPLPAREIVAEVKMGAATGCARFGRLFFCYRQASSADISAMRLIQEGITSGRLRVETEFVDLTPDLSTHFKARGSGSGRTQESAEHQAMKAWIQAFLRAKGIGTATEVSELGYHVDVGSHPAKIFVECGDTEPAKVSAFLRHGLSIGVLQYDSKDIVWFTPSQEFQQWASAKEFESWSVSSGSRSE